MLEMIVAILLLFITFVGMAYFGYSEKVRIDQVKSNCIGMESLSAEEAL